MSLEVGNIEWRTRVRTYMSLHCVSKRGRLTRRGAPWGAAAIVACMAAWEARVLRRQAPRAAVGRRGGRDQNSGFLSFKTMQLEGSP